MRRFYGGSRETGWSAAHVCRPWRLSLERSGVGAFLGFLFPLSVEHHATWPPKFTSRVEDDW